VTEDTIPRRKFLLGAGIAGTAVATGLNQTEAAAAEAQAQAPAASPAVPQAEPLLTLNETEHAFIVAAVDTLIPADELSPSGSDCGVATFIDRQLASAWAAVPNRIVRARSAKANPNRAISWRSLRPSS
jgi:gluconate 2-dehydrogenase gamma chain